MLEENGLTNAKAATTPGTAGLRADPKDGVSALTSEEATHYRRTVGKLIWMIPLRPDINYCTKELSRSLQSPTMEDKAKMRHLLRYLKGTEDYMLILEPRLTTSAQATIEIHTFVDSDWAGCRTTRKSTSGAILQVLGCTIHHFSKTQGSIATSSAEAALYAIGSGTAEALGLVNFLQETKLGPKTTLHVHTDSSSAKTISTRIGVSKLTKHIALRYLYMQDLVQAGTLRIRKVGTSENPADVLTKCVSSHILGHHLATIGLGSNAFDIGEYSTSTPIFGITRSFPKSLGSKPLRVCSLWIAGDSQVNTTSATSPSQVPNQNTTRATSCSQVQNKPRRTISTTMKKL